MWWMTVGDLGELVQPVAADAGAAFAARLCVREVAGMASRASTLSNDEWADLSAAAAFVARNKPSWTSRIGGDSVQGGVVRADCMAAANLANHEAAVSAQSAGPTPATARRPDVHADLVAQARKVLVGKPVKTGPHAALDCQRRKREGGRYCAETHLLGSVSDGERVYDLFATWNLDVGRYESVIAHARDAWGDAAYVDLSEALEPAR